MRQRKRKSSMPRPRGWNLKKGGKDAPSVEELRRRGAKGGKTTGRPAGFSKKEKRRRNIEARKNQEETEQAS